ncbi:hypothetical protein [Puniceibacterium sediminis]|uniref:hypothetical protein n=1 Tax=Puniceibacterium sediminis TaxID=1608407 RepID=UPI0015962089|nr:hypothetical protein [Puniceibacterium sediminis]
MGNTSGSDNPPDTTTGNHIAKAHGKQPGRGDNFSCTVAPARSDAGLSRVEEPALHPACADWVQDTPVVRGPSARSLLVARGLFFFGKLVVPGIVAQSQLAWKRLGFAVPDLASLLQEFLNKGIIGGFFGDMFHKGIPIRLAALLSRTI